MLPGAALRLPPSVYHRPFGAFWRKVSPEIFEEPKMKTGRLWENRGCALTARRHGFRESSRPYICATPKTSSCFAVTVNERASHPDCHQQSPIPPWVSPRRAGTFIGISWKMCKCANNQQPTTNGHWHWVFPQFHNFPIPQFHNSTISQFHNFTIPQFPKL